MAKTKKSKVIIIGAGPAGLTTAYELVTKSKNYEVVVLEASSVAGGISKTVKYNGNRMDIGGHRFFTKEQRVKDLWFKLMPVQGKDSLDDKITKTKKELNPKGPNPEKEDFVMLKRNRVSRIYYLKKFFDYPVSLKWETIKNMGFVRTIQAGLSYIKSIFFKKKEDSLENFYINRFGKKLYSMFFEKYTEKLWGRHPSEIDSSWGSQRVKGLSIVAVLKDALCKIFHIKGEKQTSLIDEFVYPKYGPGQLWELCASLVEKNNGKVLYNHEVKRINCKNNKIVSLVCEYKGKEVVIEGDYFVSSMPIKDLIEGMNDVPKKVKNIATGLPYRDFITVGLLLKKLNLKNETKIKTVNNIVPDCWIYVQEPNVKMGRIQVFNNWSPYMVDDLKKHVWIGLEYFCNENDEYWNMSEEKFTKMAILELVKMGIIDADDVIDSHQEKVKKAYPAYFDTYENFDIIKDYLNKYDNLYCIGRNGQHRYNNMDHSMMTGFLTADSILKNKDMRDAIWNVNTEEEYHEENKEK